MPSMRGIGPLTYSGSGRSAIKLEDLPSLQLRVVEAQQLPSLDLQGSFVLVHPDTSKPWADAMQPTCLVQLSSGSDCIYSARADSVVPLGCIVLDSVQQHNWHAAPAETYAFSVFIPPEDEDFELCEVVAEARLLQSRQASCCGRVEVDAARLAGQLQKQYVGHVLAANQQLLIRHADVDLVLRITEVQTLDTEAREEAVAYHCFRGYLTPDTQILLTARASGGLGVPGQNGADAATVGSACGHCEADQRCQPGDAEVVLVNNRAIASKQASHNAVNVYTRDGEWFPVKRRLLRPCISLTGSVRDDAQESVSVNVDIDTLVFDRVLIFLEAEAMGRAPPQFATHHLEDLLAAAEVLGLRSLQSYCETRLGGFEARLRLHSWADIQQRNNQGACLLVLDGMVLDVKRWLPEHPGGSAIIPKQALNLDCARFFEVYHASRESFMYLKEFYVGEVRSEDRPLVPCEEPSQDFLHQLRQYTAFRMPPNEPETSFKSF